jgi:hypothetical protein
MLCLADDLRRSYEVTDCGGLTAEGRVRREKVRLQAAQMFEQGIRDAGGPPVAGQHQVVYQRRRCFAGQIAHSAPRVELSGRPRTHRWPP